MAARLKQHWFLAALLLLLVAGMGWPAAWEPIARVVPRSWIVAGVLLGMSVTLDSGSMWQALTRPRAVLLAVAINALVAPPLAWLAAGALEGELAIGLIVAACVPCTLASAAVWTRRAGGNDAVALLVTMITNLGSFLVIPAWLALLLGEATQQPFAALIWRLIRLAVIPVLAGQWLRRSDRVARLADAHRKSIGVAAQLGILSMVLVGAVNCGLMLGTTGGGGTALGGAAVARMLSLVVLLHTALLGLGWGAARWGGLSREDRIATALAGSQKTLMIGLDIALVFGGLAILPMVAYHMVQLVIDTLVADRLRRGGPLVRAGQSD